MSREHTLRCGDSVFHRPTGETWIVAYADYDNGRLSPMGWPPGEVPIAECDSRETCSDEEHEKAVDLVMGAGVFRHNHDDHARRRVRTAYLYRPAALIPDAKARIETARAELAHAESYLADLMRRAGLTIAGESTEKANDDA